MPGIRQTIKKYLMQRGKYNDLKYSSLFKIYQRLFKPYVIRNHQKEVTFYKSFLSPCDLIFDIGAYDGHKTAAFLEISNKVVCCEPDELNLDVLRSRFRKLKNRVSIEPSAVADSTGQALFIVHHKGSAFNTLNSRWKEMLEADQGKKWDEVIAFSNEHRLVNVTTLDELIKKYGKPYFIKIDVEGSESKVLSGLTEKVPFLSFESLLPDFSSELQTCLDIIHSLSPDARFNIAEYERLLFASFVDRAQLQAWISSTIIHHFEVVVKM